MSREQDTAVVSAEPLAMDQALAFMERVPYFVVLIDRQYRFRWLNRLDPTLRPEDVLGQPVSLFVQEDSRPQALAAIEECFVTGKVTHYEVKGYADGHLQAHYVTDVIPVPPASDGTERVVQITIDVTRQAETEDALSRSEERFRLLTESSPDLIGVVDRERRILFLNREPKTDTGLTSEAIADWRVDDLTHPDNLQAAIDALETVFNEGTPASYDARGFRDADRMYSVRVLPLPPENDARRALVISTDVTERRQAEARRRELESQLQAAQKMELVGQLAGGVAHDFNNLLLVIMNQVDFLERALDRGQDPRAEIPQLRAATDRAAELVKQLLTFGRRQPMRTARLRLSKVLERAMPLLRRALPESIELVQTIDRDGWVVADAAQLEQVLLNLCVNARDAMNGVGRITFQQKGIMRHGLPCLALSVTDTGCGIGPEVVRHIFEPYFTTKNVGQGSGLGLSMVDGIIARHEGSISVDSTEGEGTTFTIVLPESQEHSDPENVEPAAGAFSEKGEGTILVAEDQPAVRRVVTDILKSAGYEVVQAEDGLQAVEYLANPDAQVDLVLLDAVMPKLNGGDAFLRMRELRPTLKVMFTSGYAADALPLELLERESIRLIPKPYRAAVLLEAIKDVLRG